MPRSGPRHDCVLRRRTSPDPRHDLLFRHGGGSHRPAATALHRAELEHAPARVLADSELTVRSCRSPRPTRRSSRKGRSPGVSGRSRASAHREVAEIVLRISQLQPRVDNQDGPQSGTAGSSVWGDDGGRAAAEDSSRGRAPWRWNRFRDWRGFDAARRTRLPCSRGSGSLDRRYDRYGVGGRAKLVECDVAGARARFAQRRAVAADGVGHRSDADGDGSTVRRRSDRGARPARTAGGGGLRCVASA